MIAQSLAIALTGFTLHREGTLSLRHAFQICTLYQVFIAFLVIATALLA
jgi:hypothetical protein